MITFHGGEQSVWEAIKERTVPRTPIMAAIAYFTDADALPLKAGDVLICNLSKRALSTGSSNPMIARDLAADGIEIRSFDHLHAKVMPRQCSRKTRKVISYWRQARESIAATSAWVISDISLHRLRSAIASHRSCRSKFRAEIL